MILADRFYYPPEFHKKSLIAFETALGTARAYAPWRLFDPGAGSHIDERYDAVPELTKQMIRDHFPTGLLPNGKNIEKGLLSEEVEYTYTSGTTGDRVINIWDQNWWDRAEASSWKLNAHTAKMPYPQREAKLASSLNVGISCEEDLPVSHRKVGEKLYLNEKINMIQWQPRHFMRMAAELKEFRPVILETNPSLLARLAYWAIDEGVEMYSPAAIIFTYEFISKIHLTAIRKVFTSPLISSFGTTETGFVLQECEAGYLHQNIDFCRIDFHPLKEGYGGPELGRMLVTTFGNPWNSVVKFDTGDLVRLHRNNKCACGRGAGLIAEAVEGRTTNCTFATNGGLVTTMALDSALAAIPGVRDYHMEQHDSSNYTLRLMAGKDISNRRVDVFDAEIGAANAGTGVTNTGADLTNAASAALKSLYGDDGYFDVLIVDNIYPGPAGKFRRTQANFEYDWKGWFI